jgi:hypothetical protein
MADAAATSAISRELAIPASEADEILGRLKKRNIVIQRTKAREISGLLRNGLAEPEPNPNSWWWELFVVSLFGFNT